MATNNSDLHTARNNAADEFYTSMKDIEKEMAFYGNYFQNKTVFLPCDTAKSQFYIYFKNNFEALGLKTLVALSYPSDNYISYYGKDMGDDLWNEHNDDGSFEHETFSQILEECDVVVTNPPFSLFRKFITKLLESKKDFIVLGNINAVTYKEVFPHIINHEIRLGPSIHSGDREFLVPDDYPLSGTSNRTDSEGNKYIRVKGVRWFTNLTFPEISVKHTVLTHRYSPLKYKMFDYYDAINVNTMKEIPYDYKGEMGCPITVMDKMNADDLLEFATERGTILYYRIIGMLNSGNHPEYYDFKKPIVDDKCKFKRIIIQRIN